MLPATPVDHETALRSLPTQHTPPRWRQQTVTLLLDVAVGELAAGRNPRRSVRGLLDLGAGVPGQDATDVLDQRLDAALAAWVEQQRRACAADPEHDTEGTARDLVAPLFDRLSVGAVDGRPHPGGWVASSVDELPCAVHGYERDTVDCLRMAVETYLVDTVDRAVDRADARPAPLPGDASATARLWLGVAVLAAWGARGTAAPRL